MKRILFIGLIAVVVACASRDSYDNSKVTIVLGFSARALCSCLFVSGMTETQCRQYTELGEKAPRPRYAIDLAEKRVTASYFFFLRQSARFENPEFGCSLQ